MEEIWKYLQETYYPKKSIEDVQAFFMQDEGSYVNALEIVYDDKYKDQYSFNAFKARVEDTYGSYKKKVESEVPSQVGGDPSSTSFPEAPAPTVEKPSEFSQELRTEAVNADILGDAAMPRSSTAVAQPIVQETVKEWDVTGMENPVEYGDELRSMTEENYEQLRKNVEGQERMMAKQDRLSIEKYIDRSMKQQTYARGELAVQFGEDALQAMEEDARKIDEARQMGMTEDQFEKARQEFRKKHGPVLQSKEFQLLQRGMQAQEKGYMEMGGLRDKYPEYDAFLDAVKEAQEKVDAKAKEGGILNKAELVGSRLARVAGKMITGMVSTPRTIPFIKDIDLPLVGGPQKWGLMADLDKEDLMGIHHPMPSRYQQRIREPIAEFEGKDVIMDGGKIRSVRDKNGFEVEVDEEFAQRFYKASPPAKMRFRGWSNVGNLALEVGGDMAAMVATGRGYAGLLGKVGAGGNTASKMGVMLGVATQVQQDAFNEAFYNQGVDAQSAGTYALLYGIGIGGVNAFVGGLESKLTGAARAAIKLQPHKLLAKGGARNTHLFADQVWLRTAKDVVGEIGEEAVLEPMVGNMLGMWMNARQGTQFDTEFDRDEFIEALAITPLVSILPSVAVNHANYTQEVKSSIYLATQSPGTYVETLNELVKQGKISQDDATQQKADMEAIGRGLEDLPKEMDEATKAEVAALEYSRRVNERMSEDEGKIEGVREKAKERAEKAKKDVAALIEGQPLEKVVPTTEQAPEEVEAEPVQATETVEEPTAEAEPTAAVVAEEVEPAQPEAAPEIEEVVAPEGAPVIEKTKKVRRPRKSKLVKELRVERVDDAIAGFFLEGGRVFMEDFNRAKDPNLLTPNIKLQYTTSKPEKGTNIDVLAQEILDKIPESGMDEQQVIEAITQFMIDNSVSPRGTPHAYARQRIEQQQNPNYEIDDMMAGMSEEQLANATDEEIEQSVDEAVTTAREQVEGMPEETIEEFNKLLDEYTDENGEVNIDALESDFEKSEQEGGFDPKFLNLSEDAYQKLQDYLKEADARSQVSGKDVRAPEAPKEQGPAISKSPSERELESQIEEAQKEVESAKKALDAKRKDLDKRLVADQEDLFGGRESQTGEKLFDVRAEPSARAAALAPLEARLAKAEEELSRLQQTETPTEPELFEPSAEAAKVLDMETEEEVQGEMTTEITPEEAMEKFFGDKIVVARGAPPLDPAREEKLDREINELKGEIKKWWDDKSMGYAFDPERSLDENFRLFGNLVQLGMRYIQKGINNVIDFAKAIGSTVSGFVARSFATAQRIQNSLNNQIQFRYDLNFWGSFREDIQDTDISIKRMLNDLRKAGIEVTTNEDYYIAKELIAGKTEAKIKELETKIFGKPRHEVGAKKTIKNSFMQRLKDAGLNIETLGNYMHARHAPFRNARVKELMTKRRDAKIKELENKIAEGGSDAAMTRWTNELNQINEGLKLAVAENGSGMHDHEAQEFLDNFDEQGKTADLERFAEEFTELVIKPRLDMLEESGLISSDLAGHIREGTREGYESKMEFYVPLNVKEEFLDEETAYSSLKKIGSQIEALKGTGRFDYTQRENPVQMALIQYEATVRAAEQNKALQRFYNLIKSNPADVWAIVASQKQVEVNEAGDIKAVDDFTPQDVKDNSLAVAVDGKIKYLFIPPIKGEDGRPKQHPVIRAANMQPYRFAYWWDKVVGKYLRMFNQFQRFILTTGNIFWGLPNFFRDLQESIGNLSIPQGEAGLKEVKRNMLANIPSALATITRSNITGEVKTPMDEHWEEAVEHGMKMTWLKYDTIQEQLEILDKRINTIEEGRDALQWTADQAKAVFARITLTNDILENVMRLAAYGALRDAGMDADAAASAGKNITINFEKKGRAGSLVNSAYLFMNAGIQSATIGARMVKSKQGRYFLSALTAAALLNRLLYYAFMDDEDIIIHDDIKTRNNVLLINPFDRSNPITIPKPYSVMRVFMSLGEGLADIYMGKKTPMRVTGDVFANIQTTFDPIGGSQENWISGLAPTIAQPIIEIGMNEGWHGKPILPYHDKPGLEYKKFTPRTRKAYLQLGKAMYENLGVDVSPTYMQYFVESNLGGTIREMGRIGEVFGQVRDGELPDPNVTPLLRRFYAPVDKRKELYLYSLYSLRDRPRYVGMTREEKAFAQKALRVAYQESLKLDPKKKKSRQRNIRQIVKDIKEKHNIALRDPTK